MLQTALVAAHWNLPNGRGIWGVGLASIPPRCSSCPPPEWKRGGQTDSRVEQLIHSGGLSANERPYHILVSFYNLAIYNLRSWGRQKLAVGVQPRSCGCK